MSEPAAPVDPAEPAAKGRGKAAEVVAAELRRQIVSGERAEGEMLPPEAEMTAELGVSRPTLRQALRILETELLVTVQRGRRGGTRVNRPSPQVAGRYLGNVLMFHSTSLDDVHTARLLLEPAAIAELASSPPTSEQIAKLRDLVAATRDETDFATLCAVGGRFHTELVALANNPPLTLFQELVQQLIDAHTARFENQRLRSREPSRSQEGVDVHEQVVDLIEAGKFSDAAKVWREHLEFIHRRLAQTVDTASVLDLEI
ncbi:FadR/GntR family transcriptional regulator [Sporichthya polymorpha]|uniref:FadR/GntR family transcriptional regulator n=1 Tax=Sporichthya polymorpha TaxID=35751 RepID=UPI0003764CEE|nr:FCD domain-containing protein [Sporichthya polymorpha]